MTPDRWQQLTSLYDAALQRAADERDAFVRDACGSDEALAREVLSLLASPESAAAFLSRPAVEGAPHHGASHRTAVLAPGEEIGQYRIEGLVGRGGMGEVYRALDLRLGRDVAIKILPPALTSDPTRLARFESEARVLASLNHPHIGAIYGVEERGDVRALVLEFVEGQTLDELVPLPIPDALAIARQIVNALDAAHERGIVHRDLKPANVKVTAGGVVKLLDFGLAKVHATTATWGTASDRVPVAHHTEEGLILGTVAYMSPEQARGQPVDKRTDIWAFGCVLFEMLSGRRPFDGATSSDVLAAILERDVDWSPLPAATPEPVRRLLARCFEKNPLHRLRDIGDAGVELDPAAGRGVAASHAGRGRGRRWRRREWLAVATLPAVAAFAAGRYWRSPPSPAHVFRPLTTVRGTIWRARFSRNGNEILYSATSEGGRSLLYSIRLGEAESRPLSRESIELFSVSHAGELAVALNPNRRDRVTRGTLSRMDASGVAPRRVCEDVIDADWNSEGTELAVVLGNDLTREYQLEYPPDNVLYRAQKSLSAVRMAPDGQSIAVADSRSVFIVDLAGRVMELSTDWVFVNGAAWSPDGSEVWFSASGPLSERLTPGIYAVSLSGRLRRLVPYLGSASLCDTSQNGRLLMSSVTSSQGVGYRDRTTGDKRDVSWLDWSSANDISYDGSTLLLTVRAQAGGPGTVYARRLDGSRTERLGSGMGLSFSPTGSAALALQDSTSGSAAIRRLVILSVGSSWMTVLASGDFNCTSAFWFPDGRRVLVVGNRLGRPGRTWLRDLDQDDFRPITAEGITGHHVAPDGVRFLSGRNEVRMVTGGEPRIIRGIEDGDLAIGWDGDGRHIYVRRDLQPREINKVEIVRLNIETGRREVWDAVDVEASLPADRLPIAISRDGRTMTYTYLRTATSLYVVEGVK